MAVNPYNITSSFLYIWGSVFISPHVKYYLIGKSLKPCIIHVEVLDFMTSFVGHIVA